jgi:D-alanyl-D-alanine carboxypeptidase/D-alanyl-D-alanine endopeptidase (penicillin-binding protein 7)
MKKLFLLLLFWSGVSYGQGSYALFDYESNYFQVEHNVDETRPIASITKLFTAITVLRSGAELDEKVKVQGKSGGRFPRGTLVTRMDLMKAMLISSDNLAAETLANTYPGGFNKYLEDANAYVKGIGMIHTELVDASGLLPGNVSNVQELVHFLYIIKNNPTIRNIANERNTTIALPKGKKTIKINLKNTNPTLFHFDNILISKTGTTNAAGKCLVMLVEKNRSLHAVVILGQKNGPARTQLAENLLNVKPIVPVKEEPKDIFEFGFPL